MNKNIYF